MKKHWRRKKLVPNEIIGVKATIRLLTTTEESGRVHPIRSGYRPNHNFASADEPYMHVGVIELVGCDEAFPGQTVAANVWFLPDPLLVGMIEIGREWRIQEARKLVAFGTIEQILDAPE